MIKNGKYIKCQFCRKEFYIPKCKIGLRKFCSKKCQYKGYKLYYIPPNKDKKFTVEHKNKLSIVHKRIAKKGAELKWWKGGRSRGYKTGYWSTEYKLWRKKVFERDNYVCQICRKVGGYLTAHHIKSFTFYPQLRFDINNGITLCEDCHKLTDNYMGRAKR